MMPDRFVARLAGLTLFLAVTGSFVRADEAPTERDIADMVDHVRDFPPKSYDIDVVVEFELKKLNEADIRKSVVSIYDRTDDAANPNESKEDRNRQIDREVNRLLEEQKRPRRIRKRCQYVEGLGYRVESVIERLGNDPLSTGPAESAAFQEIHVNVGPDATVDSPASKQVMRLVPLQKLASLYADSGARIHNEHVWTGGTVGWLPLAGLKTGLQIGKSEEAKLREALLKGEHPGMSLRVSRGISLPDGTKGRRYVMNFWGQGKSFAIAWEVPADSFNPVWKVDVGNKTLRRVLEAKDGAARVWVDDETGTPGAGKKYTLISRKLGADLDPSLFKFVAPAGYDYVDHTVNPPRTVYADGREVVGKTVAEKSSPMAVRRNPGRWILFGNLFIVIALTLFTYIMRRRRVKSL